MLSEPKIDPEKNAAINAFSNQVLKSKELKLVEFNLPYAKYEFLRYMVEQKGVLGRGSNHPDVTVFEPQEGSDYFGDAVEAVFGATDGIWPIFFAIVNHSNPELTALWNSCKWASTDAGVLHKVYAFALNEDAFIGGAFIPGWVYLLPGDSFQPVESKFGLPTVECVSQKSVRPLARLSVSPQDFPFLEQVQRFDVQDMMTYQRALSAVSKVIEHLNGFTLFLDRREIPMPEIDRAIRFIKSFYPSWRLGLSGRFRDEASLEVHFPGGAIRFCKEELMGEIQSLHKGDLPVIIEKSPISQKR